MRIQMKIKDIGRKRNGVVHIFLSLLSKLPDNVPKMSLNSVPA